MKATRGMPKHPDSDSDLGECDADQTNGYAQDEVAMPSRNHESTVDSFSITSGRVSGATLGEKIYEVWVPVMLGAKPTAKYFRFLGVSAPVTGQQQMERITVVDLTRTYDIPHDALGPWVEATKSLFEGMMVPASGGAVCMFVSVVALGLPSLLAYAC